MWTEIMNDKMDVRLSLVEEILGDLESNRVPLESICLKAARLAKLLDADEYWNKLTDMSIEIKRLENAIETLSPGLAIPKMMVQTLQAISNAKEAIQRN